MLDAQEKEILKNINAGYENLNDKGAVYVLGVIEGMATQKQLAQQAEKDTA